MKTWSRVALAASLALACNVASAIPLQINVQTASFGGSQGSWLLTGTTPGSGDWAHLFLGSDSWDLDIQPGLYDWSIEGSSLGVLGIVAWNLRLDGSEIYGDSQVGAFRFALDGNHSFTAQTAALPALAILEPQTLTLFGIGLGLLAFGLGRKKLQRAAQSLEHRPA